VAVWDVEEKDDVKYCKKGETAQEVGKKLKQNITKTY
jgi:hypothetical protein